MIAAAVKTREVASPGFRQPSQATLQRIETVLTITLAAQVVGLVFRYAL